MKGITLDIVGLIERLHDAACATVVNEGFADWPGLHRLTFGQLLARILRGDGILLGVVRRLATEKSPGLLERHSRR